MYLFYSLCWGGRKECHVTAVEYRLEIVMLYVNRSRPQFMDANPELFGRNCWDGEVGWGGVGIVLLEWAISLETVIQTVIQTYSLRNGSKTFQLLKLSIL